MVRQKATGATTLGSWADADKTLKKIGETASKIAAKEAAATAKIEQAKATLKRETDALVAEKTSLLHDVEEFAKLHKAELTEEAGKKSIVLNHGSLGFRKSTKIKLVKVAKIVERIKAKGRAFADKHLHIKESPNKEALRKLDDETLESLGVIRDVSDEFWCEPSMTTLKTGPKDAA